MKIVYSFHSLWKIKRRKIEIVWSEEAIKCPDLTKRQGYKYIITKRLNGKILGIVYIKEKHIKVVTAYWIRK